MKHKLLYILIGSFMSFTPAFAVYIYDSFTDETSQIKDFTGDPLEAYFATSTFSSIADYDLAKTEYSRHKETILYLTRIHAELIKLNEKN